VKASTISNQETETVSRENVVLYLGSSNSASSTKGNTKHLAVPGEETTLCKRVDIEYNQNGNIHGAKHCSYKGPDRVLGRICSNCLEKVQGQ